MSDIAIPHQTLLESINKIQELGLILGADCQLDPHSFTLKIPLTTLDRLIEQGLSPTPSPHRPIISQPAKRIDRTVEMSPDQHLKQLDIDATFTAQWTAAEGDRPLERAARAAQLQAKRRLRLEVITPQVLSDIDEVSTIVYGGQFEKALNLDQPTGKELVCRVLIHYTHPCSPEDLYLREGRIKAAEIYRYRVPGLDDGDWMKQNEPRGRLDAIAWRKLVLERLSVLM